MATPDNLDDWISRLVELGELDTNKIIKAYEGDAAGQAYVKAWAAEIQAAAIFIASYTGPLKARQEMMVEVANQIIDTAQGILLALGISYLLKKIRKKKLKVAQVKVTKAQALKELGDKVHPIPSRAGTGSDKIKDTAFLKLRMEWLDHFILTVMQGIAVASKGSVIWVAKKDVDGTMDSKVCSICRDMDGRQALDGNFIPIIIELFPAYKPYTNWMGWPHAHPRCRCTVKVVKNV